MHKFTLPVGSLKVTLVIVMLKAAPNDKNASTAIGKLSVCCCTPSANVISDVAGTYVTPGS